MPLQLGVNEISFSSGASLVFFLLLVIADWFQLGKAK